MISGNTLNYRHLLYFWMVVRRGGVTQAARALNVTQPTISSQLRELEGALGVDLLRREGRGVVPTEVGMTTFRYADRIFALGHELVDALASGADASVRLVVGIADALPRMIVTRLLSPIFAFEPSVRLTVRTGPTEHLLAALASHEVDIVVVDAPVGPGSQSKTYNHRLGESVIAFFGADELLARYDAPFPELLNEVPLLLPTPNTEMRRSVDAWFESQRIQPRVVLESQDALLLKMMGEEGRGVFPAPLVVGADIERRFGVRVCGTASTAREAFYAVTTERRIEHPALALLTDHARHHVFGVAAG